ncbi:uncharacterized protein LOC108030206 [Drosophila biarmipes]|uniref:uncharacterized protein LOC108030206 n=1 Tax=Drosophila biarmipes TaxID=125945 RepID=UPI0007E79A83|nr:uncharacterized protein LOC108030206 [Drosophila biarmipes]
MGKLVGILFGLFLCLQCAIELHGLFMKFTNVTCESKDLSMGTVEFCELKTLGKNKNSISLRYSMLKPVYGNIGFHFQLMTKASESSDGTSNWQPFLYAMDLDMCRFWKNRHNYLARMLFELIKGHSNLNHSCPYSKEKFIAIEDITNTDISSQIRGVPMAKGSYALFTRWSTENITRVMTNFYFDVLSV